MRIAGFPDVIHETLDIPDHYKVICEVAIGYPVAAFRANNRNIAPNPLEQSGVFVDR